MPRKKSFVGTHFGEVKLCNTPHKFSFSQMRDITEITSVKLLDVNGFKLYDVNGALLQGAIIEE